MFDSSETHWIHNGEDAPDACAPARRERAAAHSRRSRRGRVGSRRGFVLFLALGVLTVLFLLALAASASARHGRSVARLHDDRNDRAAARFSVESLARSSPDGLPETGAMPLGRRHVEWRTVPLGDSAYAKTKPPVGGELRVVRVVARRGGSDHPVAFAQEVLMIREQDRPWGLAAWVPVGHGAASAAPAR